MTLIPPFTRSPSRQNPSTYSEDMDIRLSEENSRISAANAQAIENNALAQQVIANLQLTENSKLAAKEAETNARESELNAASAANYVGEWKITTPYLLGQSVSKNGFFYRCAISNTGQDPTTLPSSYWKEVAPLLKELLETLFPEGNKAYKLGVAGGIGFGVATAPYKDYTSAGMVPLEGHTMPLSPNYGNYLHMASGSIMVYVPKHYYKIDGNTFYFSDTALDGYVLDRSFINAGVEKNGIFVMKYGASNNNGVYASIALRAPISTATTNNPQSALLNTPSNTLGGCYKAVKSMDAKAFLTPLYVYAMLARLAYAHGKAATTTTACAFITVNPRLPKGNNNNALKDVNDVTLTFTSAGNATYPACALTGSGSNFAKTTHNGQASGIADLNGNLWEVASGFIRKDVNGFMVLKESVDISSLTDDGTGILGAYNVDLYDVLDVSSVIDVIGTSYFGNGTNPVFEFATDRTSAAYKRTSIGLPLATGVSGAGATDFGNDGLYKNFINDMAPICGGYWNTSSSAGVFAMSLNGGRTYSGYNIGSRASLYAL